MDPKECYAISHPGKIILDENVLVRYVLANNRVINDRVNVEYHNNQKIHAIKELRQGIAELIGSTPGLKACKEAVEYHWNLWDSSPSMRSEFAQKRLDKIKEDAMTTTLVDRLGRRGIYVTRDAATKIIHECKNL